MSSTSSRQAAAAVGGKSARACDSCLRRRARWYCAADDAFLCQACDASVHSANPLARRHERLRLRPTSPSPPQHGSSSNSRDGDQAAAVAAASTTSSTKQRRRNQQHVAPAAAWSKRKARTRSRRPHVKSVGQLLSRKLVVVPEVASGSESSEEQLKTDEDDAEEQLLYHRVPSFDRALAELCSPPVDDVAAAPVSTCRRENDNIDGDGAVENDNKNKGHPAVGATSSSSPVHQLPDGLVAGFGPTDAELREFAADMEALLGQGLDDSHELDESFYLESLGLMTPQSEDGGPVKPEHDGCAMSNRLQCALGFGHDDAAMMKSEQASADVLGMDFNCCSVDDDDDDDEGSFAQMQAATGTNNGGDDDAADAQFLRRSLDLRLDYEAVIESWGASPWTDGQRPHDVQLDDFWPHHAYHHSSGAWPAGGGRPGGGERLLAQRWGADGGREARVSRYREKRRTRLFAKKIRYEVRKLNAEKRPRMKGRFVKRPPAAGGGAAIAAAPCAVT